MSRIETQDAAVAAGGGDDDDDERHTDHEHRRDNDVITESADSHPSNHNDDGELHTLLVN